MQPSALEGRQPNLGSHGIRCFDGHVVFATTSGVRGKRQVLAPIPLPSAALPPRLGSTCIIGLVDQLTAGDGGGNLPAIAHQYVLRPPALPRAARLGVFNLALGPFDTPSSPPCGAARGCRCDCAGAADPGLCPARGPCRTPGACRRDRGFGSSAACPAPRPDPGPGPCVGRGQCQISSGWAGFVSVSAIVDLTSSSQHSYTKLSVPSRASFAPVSVPAAVALPVPVPAAAILLDRRQVQVPLPADQTAQINQHGASHQSSEQQQTLQT